MLPTLTFCTFSILIPMLLLVVMFMVSARSMQDREKLAAFECGFDTKSTARLPFSLRFFLLAVIFLVFDIEIVLLMPLPIMMNMNMIYQLIIGSSIFLLILIIGLLHEWREGSLNWSK